MKVFFEGGVYPSFKELCFLKGLNYEKACRERRLGVPLGELVNNRPDIRVDYRRKKVEKKGKYLLYGKREFHSLLDLCDQLGISYSTVYGRMNRGKSLVSAVERCYMRGFRICTFELNGIPYERLSDVALDYNLDYLELCKRIKLTGDTVGSVRMMIDSR